MNKSSCALTLRSTVPTHQKVRMVGTRDGGAVLWGEGQVQGEGVGWRLGRRGDTGSKQPAGEARQWGRREGMGLGSSLC